MGIQKKYTSTGDTKERLISASIELFAEKGIIKTTYKNIAERAGIKRQSLHHYFGNKDDILKIILSRYEELVHSSILSIDEIMISSDKDPEEILIKLFFSFKGEHKKMFQNIVCIIHKNQFYSNTVKEFVLNKEFALGEKRIENCFDVLIEKKILNPFNTSIWASVLYKTIYSYGLLAVMTDWQYDKDSQMILVLREAIRGIVLLYKI